MSTFDKIELNRMNYGVVLNDLVMASDKEVDLGDWVLRRATLDEISQFRLDLVKFSLTGFVNQVPSQEVNITEAPQGGYYHTQIADSKEWRYMIVTPKGAKGILGNKLSEALKISDWDLWVEWWSAKGMVNGKLEDKLGGSPYHCLRFLTEDNDVTVTKKTCFIRLKEIITCRKNFEDEKYPAIAQALIMFREQDANRESSLKHLGYFAIIESILSHAPTPNDSSGSISRQLKRNLVLLHNRMAPEYNLLFDKFNGTAPEKLISKLYSYRSSIAHGNNSEKEIGWFYENRSELETDIKFINQKQFMNWYLRKLVQRVLVQAIKEPQLVTDLKG